MKLRSLTPGHRGRTDLLGRQSNPFGSLQREIDSLFDDFRSGLPSFGSAGLTPSMDVSETDGEIELTAELPGLEEKDVDVTLVDNVLTIKGEKKAETEKTDKDFHLVERSYGAFSRSLELPSGIDPANVEATMSKGVLTVKIKKPAAAESRKIEVKPTS